MFKYKSVKDQLLLERKRREHLEATLLQKNADIDYLAMMCDIELEQETQEESSYE